MKLPIQPTVPRGRIPAIMRRLAKAIDGLEEPAVEKIAQDQQEDPFQVLIATMLSAQTKDAVTGAASERLFKVARTPPTMLKLPVKQIEKLIYPVSFYRTKAVHVKQTCEQIVTRFGGRCLSGQPLNEAPSAHDALLVAQNTLDLLNVAARLTDGSHRDVRTAGCSTRTDAERRSGGCTGRFNSAVTWPE